MRLFVAVNFPEEVKNEIGRTIEKLVADFPQVAWTKKESIHLTVKFLGNIDGKFKAQNSNVKTNEEDRLLEKIKQGIEEAVVGIKPFELVFDKLGYFEREQLIVWLGAKTNSYLDLLIKQLDIEMKQLGFDKKRREFTPHITLGRGKHLDQRISQRIKQFIHTEQFSLPKSFSVSAIHLMNSTLTPKGPMYEEVRSFSLRASG